jgi:hypothetical protein
MFYGMRVFEQLQVWRTVFAVIAGVLLLDVLVLALLSRRYRASLLLRLLLVVTLALAVSAGVLAGLTEWQLRTIHIPFPSIRLPDGGLKYLTPPVVGVIIHAEPVLIFSAALVLLFEGVVLLLEGLVLAQRVVGFLASGLRTLK